MAVDGGEDHTPVGHQFCSVINVRTRVSHISVGSHVVGERSAIPGGQSTPMNLTKCAEKRMRDVVVADCRTSLEVSGPHLRLHQEQWRNTRSEIVFHHIQQMTVIGIRRLRNRFETTGEMRYGHLLPGHKTDHRQARSAQCLRRSRRALGAGSELDLQWTSHT